MQSDRVRYIRILVDFVKQAGAELGQAQLDLSSLTQLEEILAANKLGLKLR